MKKLFILGLVGVLSLLALAPAMADETASTTSATPAATSTVKFVKRAVTVRGTIAGLAGTAVPTTMTVSVKNLLPKKLKRWTGAYPAVGQTLTVQIASTTRIIRDYGAKAGIGELQPGDAVNIVARTNEDGTVTAQVVKDNSIHVYLRTGKISSIDSANSRFVLTRPNAADVTVQVSSSTKITVPNVTNPTLSNFGVGDRVIVSGFVNSSNHTVYIAKTLRLVKKTK